MILRTSASPSVICDYPIEKIAFGGAKNTGSLERST